MIQRAPALDYSVLPKPFSQLAQHIEEQTHIDIEKAMQLARVFNVVAESSNNSLLIPYSHFILGRILLKYGDIQESLEQFRYALRLFESSNRRSELIITHLHLGVCQICCNLFESARAELRIALDLLSLNAAQDTASTEEIIGLNLLAHVEFEMGRAAEALKLLHKSLELNSSGMTSSRALCMMNIGLIHARLGEHSVAIHWLSQAHDICTENCNDGELPPQILLNLAYCHYLSRNLKLAINIMKDVFMRATQIGDQRLMTGSNLNLGTYLIEASEFDEANEYLKAAVTLSQANGFKQLELHAFDSLGQLYEHRNDYQNALQSYRVALTIGQQVASTAAQVSAKINLGRIHKLQAEPQQARLAWVEAAQLAAGAGMKREQLQALTALSELEESCGHWQEAYYYHKEMFALREALFNADREQKLHNLTVSFEVERARQEAAQARKEAELEIASRAAAEERVRQRTAELAQAQREIISGLAQAAEHRDTLTGEHVRRVGHLSGRIARALGWDVEEATVLGLAARLHDVGKIGLPDSILHKPGKLTELERAQMQAHTIIGAQILSQGQSELLKLAEVIALSHHEHWNGLGYPHGLRGEEIPVAARIVAVADVFDALICERPYKPAWSMEAAMDELRAQAGQQFDPAIVDVALQLVQQPYADEPEGLDIPEDLELLLQRQLQERTLELEATRQHAEHLLSLALTDPLTGLGNRRAFELDLEQRVQLSGEQAFDVMTFDIDGLKVINDTYGHHSGDQLLMTFASALARQIQPTGRAYRMGGDEFTVIMGEPQPRSVIERLAQAVEAELQGAYPGAGASVGVASYPADAVSAGDLLRISDLRMYNMKLSRR